MYLCKYAEMHGLQWYFSYYGQCKLFNKQSSFIFYYGKHMPITYVDDYQDEHI